MQRLVWRADQFMQLTVHSEIHTDCFVYVQIHLITSERFQ